MPKPATGTNFYPTNQNIKLTSCNTSASCTMLVQVYHNDTAIVCAIIDQWLIIIRTTFDQWLII